MLGNSANVPVYPVQATKKTGFWTSRDPMRRRLLAVGDLGTVVVVAASLAIFGPGPAAALWALLSVPFWIVAAKLYGLYDRDHRALRHLVVDEVPSILLWTITCVTLLAIFLGAVSKDDLGTAATVRSVGIAILAALAFRSGARFAWRLLTPPEKVLIVGPDGLARSIRRKFELFSDMHATVVGTRRAISTDTVRDWHSWPPNVDRIILGLQSLDEQLLATVAAYCRRTRVKLTVIPPGRTSFGTAVQLRHVADLPVLEYNTWDVSRSTLLLKRVFDVVLAGALLLLASPLIVLTVLALRLSGPGPVFYAQRRAGLGGREFTIFKFRTMQADAETVLPTLVRFDTLAEPVFKLAADPRVTRLGHVLRRTSLDELPQLVNVLKGDMSLVGPRPEQVEVVRRYKPEHRFRLGVKPGLTGPMQVFGRGRLSFEERLAVEREYIENLSITRDLRILAMTLPSVVTGRGAF
jgi:exopolysaccharide biosynthesis polyprenyl glycosylphosphotransferase